MCVCLGGGGGGGGGQCPIAKLNYNNDIVEMLLMPSTFFVLHTYSRYTPTVLASWEGT